ncbi:MAG TPA: hypothetical protein VHC47_06310, partial [Mucilaginibacter sp.]|nr:hypothetical protein [Mucilaginibacter sp.]
MTSINLLNMNGWQYLLYVNLAITLFFAVYQLLLRKETFFKLNRMFLTGGLVISYLLPLVRSSWVAQLPVTQKIRFSIYADPVTIYGTGQQAHWAWGDLAVYAYFTVIIVLTIRLVVRLTRIRHLSRNASAAYSFFRKIHVNSDCEQREMIEAHENTHSDQWHSADVLLGEVSKIVN